MTGCLYIVFKGLIPPVVWNGQYGQECYSLSASSVGCIRFGHCLSRCVYDM